MFFHRFVFKRRFFVFIALIVFMVSFISSSTDAFAPSEAHASEGVFILSQTVFCDQIDVTYEVVVAFPTDTATIRAFSGSTLLASLPGTGRPDGVYSVSVPIDPAQPVGTILHAEVEINDNIGFIVTDTGSPTPCYENSSGGGNSGGGDDGEVPPPSDWDGYTDGRLNPDMAEYYTVYCHDNTALVLRASPPPTVKLADFLIQNLMDLSPNGGSYTQNGVTVERNDDQITLSGTNGNRAPEFGLKTFRLSDCIDRNGGEPDRVELPPPPNAPPDVCAVSENRPNFTLYPSDLFELSSPRLNGAYVMPTISTAEMLIEFENLDSPVTVQLTSTSDHVPSSGFDVDEVDCVGPTNRPMCQTARITNTIVPIILTSDQYRHEGDETPSTTITVTATNELGCEVVQSFDVRVAGSETGLDFIQYWSGLIYKMFCTPSAFAASVFVIPVIFRRRRKHNFHQVDA